MLERPPASAPRPRLERATHARPSERAFTLVEVIVVAVIVVILIAAGTLSLRGSKDHSHVVRGRAVAIQLGEAIQQFQRDHGSRPPGQPGTADWGNGWYSPVDRANGDRPYVSRAASEPLVDGHVAVQATDGRVWARRTSAPARIQYFADARNGRYALVVLVRRNGQYRADCWVSSFEFADISALVRSTGVRRAC